MGAADDQSILFSDGLDDAIIGWSERDGDPVAVYCAKRIVKILKTGGLSTDDAWEHLGNNIVGSWFGPRTPIVVLPLRS